LFESFASSFSGLSSVSSVIEQDQITAATVAANARLLHADLYPGSESKSFASKYLVLGVPLALWAVALLLIAVSARFNTPVVSFEPQELLAAF
jgi:hypothetical protein